MKRDASRPGKTKPRAVRPRRSNPSARPTGKRPLLMLRQNRPRESTARADAFHRPAPDSTGQPSVETAPGKAKLTGLRPTPVYRRACFAHLSFLLTERRSAAGVAALTREGIVSGGNAPASSASYPLARTTGNTAPERPDRVVLESRSRSLICYSPAVRGQNFQRAWSARAWGRGLHDGASEAPGLGLFHSTLRC